MPALRHDHPLNATVILHDLEQFPLLRLHQQACDVACLAIPDLDDGDAIGSQVLRSVGKQTAVEHQAIAPAVEGFARLIAADREG